MTLTETIISLENLRFHARHGAIEQERTVGGDYSVSLRLHVSDARGAVLHDRLEDTVNYAAVYDIVRREMLRPSALLEHVAGRMLQALFDAFPAVCEAEAKVCKLNPPMGADCDGACVALRATR